MTKLSVREIVADSYGFTFVHLGKVIALIWLPVLILTIGRYFVLSDAAADSLDPSMQGPVVVRGLLFDVAALVLGAMISVAIVREILSPVARPMFLCFGLGASELRVAGGYAGLFCLMMIFLLGFFLVTVVVAVVAKSAGTGLALGISAVAMLAGSCALIFVLVRLSFLLVPSAVMGGGFGLEQSWTLTQGNFWRIVLIGIATLGPITLVAIAANLALIGPDLVNLHFVLTQDQEAMNRQIEAVTGVIVRHKPMLLGLEFLLAPIAYGLTFAPAAFAYRALKDKTPPQA
jgi:hypothetical protein